jgi:hypothetical protein
MLQIVLYVSFFIPLRQRQNMKARKNFQEYGLFIFVFFNFILNQIYRKTPLLVPGVGSFSNADIFVF